MTIESDLKAKIFGPDNAVSAAIRRRRASLHQPEKAIRVISMGTTSVGKSEMPDLMSGNPPGYVGYGEHGVLTEPVRQVQHSVILLDETEPRHVFGVTETKEP